MFAKLFHVTAIVSVIRMTVQEGDYVGEAQNQSIPCFSRKLILTSQPLKSFRSVRLTASTALMFGVLFFSGCGGGGGGGAATSAPSAPVITGLSTAPAIGPGDAALLFPTAVGSSWGYDVQQTQTGSATAYGLAGAVVSGTGVVSGITATKFTLTSNLPGYGTYNQFYTSTGGGVTFYGNDDPTDLLTNQLAPSAALLFPISNGVVSNVLATGISAGRNSAGDAIKANLTQLASVVGVEAVTVGAGVFSNSVKLVTTTNGTLVDGVTGQSLPLNVIDTAWYAPGVGLVQEQQTGGSSATTLSQTWSARGYTVRGIQHGLSAPTALAAGVTPQAKGQSATSGSNALVLSAVSNAPIGYLVSNGGALLKSFGLSGFVAPMLAFDGTNYVSVSYAQNPADNSNYDLSLQRISPAGAVLDPSPGLFVSAFANIQAAAPLAVGGGHGQTLLVFTKYESQATTLQQHLFGMFLDSNGNSSSATGFPIQTTSTPLAGAIAFDGTNYLLVWQAQASQIGIQPIYAARVSPSGVALDAGPVLLSNGASTTTAPAVAFDGTNYLVAWGDSAGVAQGAPSANLAIVGRRISTAGTPLDGPPTAGAIQISATLARSRSYPAIAFNGIEYVIAWTDAGSQSVAAAGVKGARLTTSGTLSSGTGYEIQFSDRGKSVNGSLAATSDLVPLFTWVGFDTSFSLVDLVVYPF